MRTTWRTLLWEYGWIPFLGCFLTFPIAALVCCQVMPEPWDNIVSTVMLVNNLLALAAGCVWARYPTYGSLPEWKECHQ